MKRIPRDPERFEALQSLADRCDLQGVSINDPAALSSLVDAVKARVAEVLGDPRRVSGIANEVVFENVVIELGKAELIKREDAGGVWATIPVQPPDFRIVLTGGRQLLVEVKTVPAGPRLLLKIPAKEVARLAEYARLSTCELWFATFWESLGWWTLTRLSDFSGHGRSRTLTMEEALKRSAMNELGDVLVATVPPISVRLVADEAKSRAVDAQGEASFTIAKVELTCDGTPILDRAGKNLAFFIFLFGGWEQIGPQASLADDGRSIRHVDWRAEPDEENDGQEMRIVGPLSSLYTRFFNSVATDEAGQYISLRVPPDAGRLRRLAPADFPFGKSGLRLWILETRPNRPRE